MSDYNLVSSKDHSKKFAHFSALVFIAQVDGKIDNKELDLLKGFAKKLGIEKNEYDMILQNPERYPVEHSADISKRLRRLFEIFQIIFTDHDIDDEERKVVYQYAIELGFSSNRANDVINKSIDLFRAKFSFHEYSDFVTK